MNLNYVNCPSATVIQGHTFEGCSSLKQIEITSIEKIGASTFYGCKELEDIAGIELLEEISDSCFYNTALHILNLPLCKRIGKYAFRNCENLQEINIPRCVEINNFAFYGCNNITNSDISKCSKLGHGVFAYCSKLNRVLGLENLRKIPNDFLKGTSFKSLILTKCDSIGEGAFAECKELNKIKLPSCLYIGKAAFNSCNNLQSANLPSCITIDEQAFSNCTDLQEIDIPLCDTIASKTFFGCTKLKYIDISGASSIGNNIFQNCSYLDYVKLPNNLKELPIGIFNGCTNLMLINLPSQLNKIGNKAFCGCSSLKSIELPNGLKYIAENAFMNCTNLRSISLPSSIKNIYNNAFAGCANLKYINSLSTEAPTANNDLCEKYRYQDITLITPIGSSNYDNFPWNLFKSPIRTELSDNSSNLDTDVYIESYLSYRRSSMKSGSYATFCLPFSIDLNEAKNYFEAIYSINGNAFYKTDNGKLILMLKNINITDSIPAEYPFIVKLKDTVNEVYFYNKNLVVIDELTNPAPIQLQVYNWNGKNGLLKENTSLNVCFGGSLVTMTDKGSNYETFNSDGSFGPTNNGIVKAFRAYVIKGNATTMNNVKSITLGLDDYDETSNIEFAIEHNKSLDNNIYSIDGQIIENTNLNKVLIPKLYIKNKHKVLTK